MFAIRRAKGERPAAWLSGAACVLTRLLARSNSVRRGADMLARCSTAGGAFAIMLALSTPGLAQACVVTDPTGTPLNVRTTPAGSIAATLANGTPVTIRQYSGNWVYVTHASGAPIGWVFRPYLSCR
jgi:hypothetical protein